jgi:serine/threonine-protein kinase
MRYLAILKCIARGVVKHAGNLVGFGLGNLAAEVAEEVCKEWQKEKNDQERRAELQALVQMAAGEFREHVAAVVREAAAGQPAEVRQRVSACLEQVPELVRRSFRRSEDPQGRSVPPDLRLNQASDLLPFLSFAPGASAASGAKKTDGQPAPPPARVTLHFTQGQRTGQEIDCTEPEIQIFGRASDCEPLFPWEGHERVSRHHCLVEMNPPDARIRDLGSLHGTFLNGNLIGKRPPGTGPGTEYSSPEHDLHDGDEIRLTDKGQVAFRVGIVVPAQCAACGAGIAEDHKAACAQPAGGYLCPSCRRQGATAVKTCAWYQREVTAERGANRSGMFVCNDCRANVQAIMQDMMGQAQAGNQELRAIRDYTLLEELGHGGMGAVYLARHNRTGQPAAVKLMLPRIAADDRAVALFQREVRNTMALRHQHVVRLLDQGYARGTFFMVLEYCDGGSVDRLMVQRGGTLPVDEAGEIVLQALEGLEYAHQAEIPFVRQKDGGYGPGKGLVHRDLKPANLFLSGWGSSRLVKIGDYGLAKAFDETGLSGGTRTGDLAGTWQFMCRQQVIDYKRAGAAVDVWAMAASLYFMLTGRVPRDFPEGRDPWLAVLEDAPVPIRRRKPRIPLRLAGLIDHALVEEPEITFKTAAEFRQALESAL